MSKQMFKKKPDFKSMDIVSDLSRGEKNKRSHTWRKPRILFVPA